MSSGTTKSFSVTNILRLEAPKSSGSDMPDSTRTPVDSTPFVEEILRSTEYKSADEASNIPFSVEAILRLESSKHKLRDERPKTPFTVEDILRSETSKSPKQKSNHEISNIPLPIEDVPEEDSLRPKKLDDEAPKNHFCFEESMEASDRSSSTHRLRAALMKSSEFACSSCSDGLAYRCPSPCGPKVWIPTPAHRWQNLNYPNRSRLTIHQNSENISASLNGDLGNGSFRVMTPGLLSRGKCQVRFTVEQTAALEQAFEDQRYISPEQRRIIARRIQLSEKQVKTWFQNRRAKWKKQRLFASDVDSTCYCGSPKLPHV